LLVAAVTRWTGEHEEGLFASRPPAIGLPDLGNGPREESLQFSEPFRRRSALDERNRWKHEGNARPGIAENRLAQTCLDLLDFAAKRFYSMSAQIRQERRAYYEILESMQKGNLDITGWLEWFLACLGRAFDGSEKILAGVLSQARFWDRLADTEFNDRQRDMVNRLLNGLCGQVNRRSMRKSDNPDWKFNWGRRLNWVREHPSRPGQSAGAV